jgi:hypothetical protein
LKIDVSLFKTQIIKKLFPRTPSEKYIPGKQCPKLQECAIRLGWRSRLGFCDCDSAIV